MRELIRSHFFAATLLLAASSCFGAGTLSRSVISSFPKDISELAYSDYSHARQLPWFEQFKRQTMPVGFGEIERFLSSVGIKPDQQIDEIAWALMAVDDPADLVERNPQAPGLIRKSPHHKLPSFDDLIAIALGDFDIDASEAILDKAKVTNIVRRGHTLYSCGPSCHDFYFVFLDSGTIAFGKVSLLEHMLEVRSGSEDSVLSNPVLFPLIHKVNGVGLFWGVLNDACTAQALHRLIPEAENFPDVSKLITQMQAMTLSFEGDNELSAELEVSAEAQDANLLAQLMQAGLLFRQFQASQEDPQFAKLLQNVSVSSGGPGVQISFKISSDQMVSLLQHNVFSPKM